jgi:hypothetical protein
MDDDVENGGGKSPILPPEIKVLDDKSQTMLISESARIQCMENITGDLKQQVRGNQLIELREQYLVLSQEKSTGMGESREERSLMKLNLDMEEVKYIEAQQALEECRRHVYGKLVGQKEIEFAGRRVADLERELFYSVRQCDNIAQLRQHDIRHLQQSLSGYKIGVRDLEASAVETDERHEAEIDRYVRQLGELRQQLQRKDCPCTPYTAAKSGQATTRSSMGSGAGVGVLGAYSQAIIFCRQNRPRARDISYNTL